MPTPARCPEAPPRSAGPRLFFLLVLLTLGWSVVWAMVTNVEARAPARLVSIVALTLVHGALTWRQCFSRAAPLPVASYLLVQTALAATLGAISHRPEITTALCLCLAGQALGMLSRARALAACVVLFGVPVLHTELAGGLSLGWITMIGFMSANMWVFLKTYGRESDLREQAQRALDDLEAAHGELAARAARIEELTLATERQRMARDLHDTLAQGLAGLILQLEALEVRLERGESAKAKDILDRARERARTVLAEARQVIHDLRPAMPQSAPQSLANALRDEIARFREANGTECTAEVPDTLPLTREQAEHGLRCVSEALANCARHSRATRVHVAVTIGKDQATFQIVDNGVGFEADRIDPRNHFGLVGLRERARLAGGELAIQSNPGQGTKIRLALPLVRADS